MSHGGGFCHELCPPGFVLIVAWFAYPPDTEMFLAGEDMLARIVGQVAPTRAPKVATKFTCICRAREALK
jgi:hypothetical protein